MSASIEKLRMAPMLLIMGTIFFLSNQDGASIDLGKIQGIDKLAHGCAYGTLAATVILAHSAMTRKNAPGRVVLATVLVCLLYGLSDEFHQSFVPGRFVSAADVLADIVGAAFVSMGWLWWKKRRDRAHKRGSTISCG